jgi:streptogramin lyase
LPGNPDKRSFDFEIDSLAQKIYVASRPSDYLHVYGYDGKLLQKIHMKGREDESIQNSFGITRDHRGVFWIAGNNIFSYDPQKDKMKMFRHPVIDSVEKARRRGYMDIVEDHGGNLWFFGLAGGLFRIDSSRQEVEVYAQAGESDESRFNDLNLRELYVARDGKTWLVHEYGLTAYDPKTKAFVFHDDTEWGNGIEPLCMIQASADVFWVGTHFNGLLKLEEENGKLVLKDRISRSDGLPSELIVSIDIDENGLIWLATGKGMVRFNPVTKKMRLYSQKEGVRYPYIQGNIKILSNGKLYVSNYNGFCVLDLEEYSNPLPPKVVLKKIAVFAEDLPLDTIPNFKKGITLKYDQDFFTIEYAAIAFSQPELIRYAYRLKGYDKKWTRLPATGNTAVYTGVKPGEYEFQVMAANADGVWGSPKSLKINITPPFWETWWFYLICGLLFIGLLLYLSHLRSQRIRKKERQRAEFEKQLASMELTALRSQMNPHFIFNCLNSIKHLIATGNNEQANGYLMNFASLIRLVLENSAKERIALSEELKMTELYVKMEKLRFDDRFAYEINTDSKLDLDFVEVPPLILQPFVENAIWHGLMHKEGEAKLEIGVEEDGGMLLCIIDDNGIGREKARELKSKSATRKKSYGLRLAGNRLKLYNKLKASKVKIDMKIIDKFDSDNKPEGTTVLLKIPLWKM